eukprot:TRINITY_DN20454_c0_g1_i1.p1 TRINITY_DN20454_c0_g1~~TRINITY_DN20454_c0_g1_i1.p1  ORF type:complete len:325 (-),score=62.53 TRINITY_DN20454_c0_g1_i1:436-1386(-)
MKDETFRDLLARIWPISTFALQWIADLFLQLDALDMRSDDGVSWLVDGEVVLAFLSLFQQVWAPPFFRSEGFLFGGFGVQNTDSEWNAGHQHRFALTYADYYDVVGRIEYLERAVAATRAGFALMDIEENKKHGVGFAEVEGDLDAEGFEHLGGPGDKGLWTGLTWGSGGALSAAAMLLRRFGGAFIDVDARRAVSIDGVEVMLRWTSPSKRSLKTEGKNTSHSRSSDSSSSSSSQSSKEGLPEPSFEPDVVDVSVSCAVSTYGATKTRTVHLRFGRERRLRPVRLTLNGVDHGVVAVDILARGFNIQLGSVGGHT